MHTGVHQTATAPFSPTPLRVYLSAKDLQHLPCLPDHPRFTDGGAKVLEIRPHAPSPSVTGTSLRHQDASPITVKNKDF